MPEPCQQLYRPRQARRSPLYQLVESTYERVKGQWEERFEQRYGFWRGSVDDTVYAFLDCGVYEQGFARVRCAACRAEYLVAFSCQRRGLCPSCAAKRGAQLGALLVDEVLEPVGHCLWTFTIPKMLRPYFLHHRELLGGLCQAGWEVVRELIATAAGDAGVRPGMVAVIQTSGDLLGWNPHVHAIASRGGWDGARCWVPMPFVDTVAAEGLFRHRVITLLRDEGLLSQERIDLLRSWRHSGFSAHNAVTVAPDDTAGIERLARYLLRAPVALERLSVEAGGGEILYRRKAGGRLGGSVEVFDPADLLARLLTHVPAPRQHQIRFYGHYSNAVRGRRAKAAAAEEHAVTALVGSIASDPEPGPAERRRLRRQWAQMLRRVYEVDPLECRECGGQMKILAFVLEAGAIRKILDHLSRTGRHPCRDPPAGEGARARVAS